MTTEKDPYMLDPEEYTKFKDENKGSLKGVKCPRRNASMDGKCKVCDQVQHLFGTQDTLDREIAFEYMAKCTYYLNFVLPHDPTKSITLELGKKVGNQIINGIEKSGWVDISHPKSGKGREMQILKFKGDQGFPTYNASPVLQLATYDIPDEVLINVLNLDKIIDLVDSLEEGKDLFKISSLKMDETLKFRICPASPESMYPKRVMSVVWRHWKVTEDHINGTIDFDLRKMYKDVSGATDKEDKKGKDETSPPWEKQQSKEPNLLDEPTKSPKSKKVCFGKELFFEEGDEKCAACPDYKACAKAISN